MRSEACAGMVVAKETKHRLAEALHHYPFSVLPPGLFRDRMESVPHSWQKHLPCPVELREEPLSVALLAYDQGRPFQFISHIFASSALISRSRLSSWTL